VLASGTNLKPTTRTALVVATKSVAPGGSQWYQLQSPLVAGGLCARAGENLADAFFEGSARLPADEMAEDAAVATVENCFRHGAGPRGIYAAVESVYVNSGFLAIARESGLIFRKEAADEIHVGVVIEADAKNRKTLRRVLLVELDEHGEFVAAGLAPCGPEGDDERLAVVLREDLIVANDIDEREFGGGGLGRFGGGFGRALRE
jgi:hypothetical protein